VSRIAWIKAQIKGIKGDCRPSLRAAVCSDNSLVFELLLIFYLLSPLHSCQVNLLSVPTSGIRATFGDLGGGDHGWRLGESTA
jgi:hypothetical protein